MAKSYDYPINFPDSNKYCDRLAATSTFRKLIRLNPDQDLRVIYHGQTLVDYDLLAKEFTYLVTLSYTKGGQNITASYLTEVYFKSELNHCTVRSINVFDMEN